MLGKYTKVNMNWTAVGMMSLVWKTWSSDFFLLSFTMFNAIVR